MLEGSIRDSITKANAKALKRDGYLIANIYGKGKENIHCAFKRNDFIRFMRSKETFRFDVKVNGLVHKVVVQEYQRDPVSGDIIHVDMLFADDNALAKFRVPISVKGTPVGLKNKGVLMISKKRITVKSLAKNLPNSYEIDVTPLDVGDNVLVRDLPKIDGIEIVDSPSNVVVGVIKAK